MKKNMMMMILLAGMVLISSVVCNWLVPQGNMDNPVTIETGPSGEEVSSAATITPPMIPTSEAAAAETGAISGSLSYPSESVPPMRVIAFRVDNAAWFSVEVMDGGQFTLQDLPPGDYYVVAYLIDNSAIQGDFAGGYTSFVPCGMTVECMDHSLIPVSVSPGMTASGIDPGDWYAPENTFPPDPTR